ncbi:T9SS type A sorting domain-containing protein [Hymenobacter antarcticus]|uniref:Secretion system C-terminal sorting domain-containing protein n=1 Tax=Hymenobacter antarcticus TaxID=486270 RepID=A0ABP7PG26_9BACT
MHRIFSLSLWVWLLVGLTVLSAGPARSQTRVLFVGNSFTHAKYPPVLNYNAASIIDENFGLPPNTPRHQLDPTTPGPWGGLPGIFKKFTDQAGLNYEVHIEAINGASLEYHEAYAMSVVQRLRWDKVVLQELTTRPLPVARTGQPSLFIDYATRLEVAVHAGNPAAQVYLFQHWARADLTYPANTPYSGLPIDSMTHDLHKAFYGLVVRNPRFAAVVPIGNAWLRAIRAGVALRNPYNPTPGLLNLWNVDHIYPSKWGAYLAASVLFAQLTGRDPRTLGRAEKVAVDLGISPVVAAALQQLAYEQVMAPNGPLPVVLTSFVAQRQPAGVQLRWATATEVNNREFAVQRSSDGTHFTTVSTQPGHGTATQPRSYSYFDRQAPPAPLYYRLRQVDFDGAATFSAIVAVPGKAATELAVFPNPAHDFFTIIAPAATRYRLLNQLGQEVGQGLITNGTATVELAHLPAGLYQLSVATSDGRAGRSLVHR